MIVGDVAPTCVIRGEAFRPQSERVGLARSPSVARLEPVAEGERALALVGDGLFASGAVSAYFEEAEPFEFLEVLPSRQACYRWAL